MCVCVCGWVAKSLFFLKVVFLLAASVFSVCFIARGNVTYFSTVIETAGVSVLLSNELCLTATLCHTRPPGASGQQFHLGCWFWVRQTEEKDFSTGSSPSCLSSEEEFFTKTTKYHFRIKAHGPTARSASTSGSDLKVSVNALQKGGRTQSNNISRNPLWLHAGVFLFFFKATSFFSFFLTGATSHSRFSAFC